MGLQEESGLDTEPLRFPVTRDPGLPGDLSPPRWAPPVLGLTPTGPPNWCPVSILSLCQHRFFLSSLPLPRIFISQETSF